MRHVYAIIDLLAKDLAGPLQLFNADQPAVRWFGDVAGRQDTIVGQHVEDFILVKLGTITEDEQGIPLITSDTSDIVISGRQWKAAQQPASDELNLKPMGAQ